MDASQALREMVETSGLTHRQIARRMGRYDAYVSQMLTRTQAPGADTVASVARACGYRLELVPIGGDGASIVIGDDDADDGADDLDQMAQARALIVRGLAMLDDVALE